MRRFEVEAMMRKAALRLKTAKLAWRYFPLIPLVPIALLSASLAYSIRAFRRVRRLEHQLAA
jgi:hypothetical protein